MTNHDNESISNSEQSLISSDEESMCSGLNDQEDINTIDFDIGKSTSNTIVDKYLKFQENLYDATYSLNCLRVASFEEMAVSR